jgi:hypothetical protein
MAVTKQDTFPVFSFNLKKLYVYFLFLTFRLSFTSFALEKQARFALPMPLPPSVR